MMAGTLSPGRRASILREVGYARQLQEISAKYEGFRAQMEWLVAKIADLDDTWHQSLVDKTALVEASSDNELFQQLRGRKQAFVEVKQHFDALLRMDTARASAEVEAMDEDEENG